MADDDKVILVTVEHKGILYELYVSPVHPDVFQSGVFQGVGQYTQEAHVRATRIEPKEGSD
jgi:hypothetical protein